MNSVKSAPKYGKSLAGYVQGLDGGNLVLEMRIEDNEGPEEEAGHGIGRLYIRS